MPCQPLVLQHLALTPATVVCHFVMLASFNHDPDLSPTSFSFRLVKVRWLMRKDHTFIIDLTAHGHTVLRTSGKLGSYVRLQIGDIIVLKLVVFLRTSIVFLPQQPINLCLKNVGSL